MSDYLLADELEILKDLYKQNYNCKMPKAIEKESVAALDKAIVALGEMTPIELIEEMIDAAQLDDTVFGVWKMDYIFRRLDRLIARDYQEELTKRLLSLADEWGRRADSLAKQYYQEDDDGEQGDGKWVDERAEGISMTYSVVANELRREVRR